MNDEELVRQRCRSALRAANAPDFCSPTELVLRRGGTVAPSTLPAGTPVRYEWRGKRFVYDPVQVGLGRDLEEKLAWTLAELIIPRRLWRAKPLLGLAARELQMEVEKFVAVVDEVGIDLRALADLYRHATHRGICLRFAEALKNVATSVYVGTQVEERVLSRGLELPVTLPDFERRVAQRALSEARPILVVPEGRYLTRASVIEPQAQRVAVVTEVLAHAQLSSVKRHRGRASTSVTADTRWPAIALVPAVITLVPPAVEAPRTSESIVGPPALVATPRVPVVDGPPKIALTDGPSIQLADELATPLGAPAIPVKRERHWFPDADSQVPVVLTDANTSTEGRLVNELNQDESYVASADDEDQRHWAQPIGGLPVSVDASPDEVVFVEEDDGCPGGDDDGDQRQQGVSTEG